LCFGGKIGSLNGQEDNTTNDATNNESSKTDNDDIERVKKELVVDADEDKSSSSAILCTVPAAIRMNSGDVDVRGGMICGISNKVEKMIIKVFFKCSQCDIINHISSYTRPRFAYEVFPSTKPIKCVSCNDKSSRDHEYEVVNAVQIELQDIDTFSDLERLPVILFDDNTKNVSTGEHVLVSGSIQKIRKNSRLLPFLFASSIRYQNRKQLIMTSQDVEEIKCFTRDGSVIDLLVSKFAPSVIGYEHVKKGLLLCAANSGKDSISRRLRINALLIGETGLDKSALLRAAAELVPNSKYCSTLNSSIRSLIAVVTQEEDHYMLRVGPVPAASGAICAINEIGRMDYEDQAGFLDAMQEGKIPFGKYGFNMTLDGSATFIMSANPTNNSSWRNTEKVDLNEVPLISPLRDRFDLLFVFRTARDRKMIADYAFRKTDPHMMSDKLYEEEEKNHDFIKKYILYCKAFHPQLSEDARIMLCDYYSSIAINFGSPRVLDGLYRTSHAVARLKQKDVIDCEDVKEVMEFYNVILQQLSETVTIPKKPFDSTVEVITDIVLKSEFPYDFVELVKHACKRNESVARYIGDNFSVEYNKKVRKVRDRFKEGIDDRIVICDQKPLVLVRRSSYSDNNNSSTVNESSNNTVGDNTVVIDDKTRISKEEEHEIDEILHSTDPTDPTDPNKSNLPSNPTDARNSQERQDLGSERSDRSVVSGDHMTTIAINKHPLKTEPQEDAAEKPIRLGIQSDISNQGIFPHNLMHDPQHTLDGILVLRCSFCSTFKTPIEYDMKVHLLERHRMALVTRLPLRGKGFDMDYRTTFVIDIMKRKKPLEYYDHGTAKFVSLHN
jgi:replicative DNA helicase Mcm